VLPSSNAINNCRVGRPDSNITDSSRAPEFFNKIRRNRPLGCAPVNEADRPFSATQAFALGMALLPHLEGLFQASAWYDGSTSTAMVKEI
jgi:hypothetical protein